MSGTCTHQAEGMCYECKDALVARALSTRKGTKALFRAAHLRLPWVMAFTWKGRARQFAKAAGIPWWL